MQCILVPSARFEYANHAVRMPDSPQQCQEFAVRVVRLNDTDYDVWTSVKYYTEDNTAIAGIDYIGTNGTLYFGNGENSKDINVKICSVFSRKARNFSIHLERGNISVDVLNHTEVKIVTAPYVTEIVILGKEPVFPDFNGQPLVLDLSTISQQSITSPPSLICVTVSDSYIKMFYYPYTYPAL